VASPGSGSVVIARGHDEVGMVGSELFDVSILLADL
jgi:hypothetical protein